MLEQTFSFTKTKLLNLPAYKERYWVCDTEVPHLRLMIYPTGVKTYMVFRKVKGKSQRIKIGRFTELTVEQVRKQAVKINSLIALGGNPHLDKRLARSEATFKDLYDYYYQQYSLHYTKRPEDNRATLKFHILPAFGDMKGSEITTDKIRKFHMKLTETCAPSTANRVLTIIAAVFNFCIKNGYFTGNNPCLGIRRFRTISRDRFLNKDELEKFFNAVKQEEELFEHFFLMLLYTGARKGNVLAMKWQDIDLKLKRWRIAEDETKNSDVNIVYLSQPAIEILYKRQSMNESLETISPFVFPSIGSKGHLNDPKKAFQRVKDRMGTSNFRMHDLRRTLGSYMAIGGASIPIIGKALNHKNQVSTAIYARLSEEPVLDAINSAVSLIKGNGVKALYKTNIELAIKNDSSIQFTQFL